MSSRLYQIQLHGDSAASLVPLDLYQALRQNNLGIPVEPDLQDDRTDAPTAQEIDALIQSIDLDTIQSIADAKGWDWNPETLRWEQNGITIDDQTIRDVLDEYRSETEAQLIEATNQMLKDGDVATWQDTAEALIAILLMLSFGLGSGNTIAHPIAKRRLQAQLGFLDNFADAIRSGGLSDKKIRARISQYAHDAAIAYAQGRDIIHSPLIFPFERNVLGGCEHCPQCPEETAKGVVKRGELTPIGKRLCRIYCCCTIEYLKSRNDAL